MIGQVFDTATVLMVLASVFGYINKRFLKLPFAIGMTVSALAASAGVLLIDRALPGLGISSSARTALDAIDFPQILMHGMLSFLLFAGALHVDIGELFARLRAILTLASVGVLISTALIGVGSYYVFQMVGASVALPYCLVFGALISPTDPVAVLGIMKAAGASKGHEVKIVGESLINDGVGVVIFTVLLAIASGGVGAHGADHGELGAASIGALLLREVVGGVLLGLAFGVLAYYALQKLDEPNLEIMISVSLVMAITSTGIHLHTSAPLACVVAGLLIGNRGRTLAMEQPTRVALDHIWSFLDEALNAVLFLIVGLEVLAIDLQSHRILAALLMIPLALSARFISVALPVTALSRFESFTPGVIKLLTWGGLKGGISVALALSLPKFDGREVVLTATYAVVLFSIVVQGMTVGTLVRSLKKAPASAS